MRLHVIVILALLALSGCQRDVEEPPVGEVQESLSSPSPVTEAPALEEPSNEESAAVPTTSYEVPSEIGLVYLEDVLQALYNVEGEAARSIVAEGAVSQVALSILSAVYDSSQLNSRVQLYEEQIAQGLSDTLPTPGNVRVDLSRIVSADPGCAFVAGLRDYSEVVVNPRNRSGEMDFFMLLPAEANQDPADINPTPWVLGGSEVRTDGSEPDNPCAH